MPNRHVKVINGRKYYYESIRVGKKVTSRYLGPVERVRKKKSPLKQQTEEQLSGMSTQPEQLEGEETSSEESYIG